MAGTGEMKREREIESENKKERKATAIAVVCVSMHQFVCVCTKLNDCRSIASSRSCKYYNKNNDNAHNICT